MGLGEEREERRSSDGEATGEGSGVYSDSFRATALTPQQLTMVAVPNAWDGAPKLLGVDVKFVTDPQARVTALKTGEIDMMLYTPAELHHYVVTKDTAPTAKK